MGCSASHPQGVALAGPTTVQCGHCQHLFVVAAPHSTPQHTVMEAACPSCMNVVRFGTSQASHAAAVASAKKAQHQSEAQHMLQFLPMEAYDPGLHKDLVECEFCLEDYKAGDEMTRLPCLHVFHRRCIHTWLVTSPACPNCRMDFCKAIKAAAGNAQAGSEGNWVEADRGYLQQCSAMEM